MNQDEKLHLLEILSQLALTEANLMWTRFTTLLYASTGLLGILAFAIEGKNKTISLFCALFGLLLAAVWFQTIRLSSFYYERWQLDVDHLVSSNKDLKELIRGRLEPRLPKPKGWSASKYFTVIPVGFGVAWLLIILDALGIILILR